MPLKDSTETKMGCQFDTGIQFYVPFVKRKHASVSFVAGQQLGHYASWPMFALSHWCGGAQSRFTFTPFLFEREKRRLCLHHMKI